MPSKLEKEWKSAKRVEFYEATDRNDSKASYIIVGIMIKQIFYRL
jgi:hypothetical protein